MYFYLIYVDKKFLFQNGMERIKLLENQTVMCLNGHENHKVNREIIKVNEINKEN